MDITFSILKERLKSKIAPHLKLKKLDDVIIISNFKTKLEVETYCRLQYNKLMSLTGFRIFNNELDKTLDKILIDELKSYKENKPTINIGTESYFVTGVYSQTIESEAEFDFFLDEVNNCLQFYENEIFPKFETISGISDYVASKDFENQLEVVVGSSYPVNVFKKLAILKWGGEYERYEEYKAGLLMRFEDNKTNSRYVNDVPIFRKGYDYLIDKLENEPNPFLTAI